MYQRFTFNMLVIAAVSTGATLAHAETLRVPADFSTIQAALDAASNGDAIRVIGGTYTEHVVVDKRVRLIGRSSPIVFGSIDVQANSAIVRGFEVDTGSAPSEFAIRIAANRASVRHNFVQVRTGAGADGIRVDGNENELRNNTCEGGNNAIEVNGDGNEILDNIALFTLEDVIEVNGDGNLLEDNQAFDGAFGFDILGDGNVIVDNKAFRNSVGYYFEGSGHLVQGNDATDNQGDGFLVAADDSVFDDLNQATDNETGFAVVGSATGNLFHDNEADDNQLSGWLIGGGGNRFINNGADNNRVGMDEFIVDLANVYEGNSCKDNVVASDPGLCDDPND